MMDSKWMISSPGKQRPNVYSIAIDHFLSPFFVVQKSSDVGLSESYNKARYVFPVEGWGSKVGV